ncbi:MAG: hypothetical protein WC236_08995 [Gallionellaceae bacterium]
MAALFSEKWMLALQSKWNNSPQVYEPLQKAGFTSRIGYGFKGEPRASGYISVINGRVQSAGLMDDGELDWDLRASPEDWAAWIEHGFGLNKLGPAIAKNSLEFAKGNYRQMIQNLSLSQPFLAHFQLMGGI